MIETVSIDENVELFNIWYETCLNSYGKGPQYCKLFKRFIIDNNLCNCIDFNYHLTYFTKNFSHRVTVLGSQFTVVRKADVYMFCKRGVERFYRVTIIPPKEGYESNNYEYVLSTIDSKKNERKLTLTEFIENLQELVEVI